MSKRSNMLDLNILNPAMEKKNYNLLVDFNTYYIYIYHVSLCDQLMSLYIWPIKKTAAGNCGKFSSIFQLGAQNSWLGMAWKFLFRQHCKTHWFSWRTKALRISPSLPNDLTYPNPPAHHEPSNAAERAQVKPVRFGKINRFDSCYSCCSHNNYQ